MVTYISPRIIINMEKKMGAKIALVTMGVTFALWVFVGFEDVLPHIATLVA
jgi:hypothetical protein